ncbi:hypothetical protein E1287_16150 [Actinomadura sp. KC06]|uniref:UGSC family (seleno)protein n=1 Tax=Actinomadura sp. KC06 TaxID=2530369 RepID=UPI00104F7254|nr:hypothetical protein [Actinomadura sp. KC06]TDD34580.1 hypothetical protein E1287_16150 [Actinomadura sp. KC06]
MSRKITVLNPEGSAPAVDGKSLAPRPTGLDGTTLFLVDVGFENSGDFMAQLQASLRESRPDVATEIVHLRTPFDPVPDVYERIRNEGSAAILGVGL